MLLYNWLRLCFRSLVVVVMVVLLLALFSSLLRDGLLGFQNSDFDGCAAAIIESENGALVDVCSGDYESHEADEADWVV